MIYLSLTLKFALLVRRDISHAERAVDDARGGATPPLFETFDQRKSCGKEMTRYLSFDHFNLLSPFLIQFKNI